MFARLGWPHAAWLGRRYALGRAQLLATWAVRAGVGWLLTCLGRTTAAYAAHLLGQIGRAGPLSFIKHLLISFRK